MEKSVSDLEGDPSFVLVERVAAVKILVDRVPVERVIIVRVVLVERIASCYPIQGEQRRDPVCHL